MLKNKKFIDEISENQIEENEENLPNAPEGLFDKCNSCKSIVYQKTLTDFKSCPKCGYLHRMGAYDRIKITIDVDTFSEFDKNMKSLNPINFPNYEKIIDKAIEQNNMHDAVITGIGKINGKETCIGVMDSHFIMGSMGSVVGEKITRLFEYATEKDMAVVLFTCSGGARMQETIISLMQMAKVSFAVKKHSDKGLLYVTVLTDPTTGGVTASFAMQGDIILAEPSALVGFAGRRVIEQTLNETLPEDFQSSEFLEKCGFVDRIVERADMKDVLGKILAMH